MTVPTPVEEAAEWLKRSGECTKPIEHKHWTGTHALTPMPMKHDCHGCLRDELRQQREAGRAEGEALVRKALRIRTVEANPRAVFIGYRDDDRFGVGVVHRDSGLPAGFWWALTGEGERPKETE